MSSAFAAPVALAASQGIFDRFQIYSLNQLGISPQASRRRRSTGLAPDVLKSTNTSLDRLHGRSPRPALLRSRSVTYTASPLVVTMSSRSRNETTSKQLTRRVSDAAAAPTLPIQVSKPKPGAKPPLPPSPSRRNPAAEPKLVESPSERPLSADAAASSVSTTTEALATSDMAFADVPWGPATVARVLGLWATGLVVLGTVLVPAAELAFNVDEAEAITHALMMLFRYTIIMGSGFWLLWGAIKPHVPLSRDLFDFSFDRYAARAGMLGFVWTIPVLRLASMVNEALVHGGQTELQQTAKLLVGTEADPLAISLFLLTMSVLAPVWEETMFRGFLIPSIASAVRSASTPTPTPTPTLTAPTPMAPTSTAPTPSSPASKAPAWGVAQLVQLSVSHPSSPQVLSVVGSSVIFGAAHGSAGHMIPLTALGLVLGWVYWRTRRLAAPVVLHALWNTITVIGLLRLGPDGLQP